MAAPRTFEYTLRDPKGKAIKGRIEATNEAAVAQRLRTMGIAPLSIRQVETTGLNREIKIPGLGDKIKTKDLSIMARQLATMINAGIPTIFLNAAALGYKGTELQDDVNGDPAALARLETIRRSRSRR